MPRDGFSTALQARCLASVRRRLGACSSARRDRRGCRGAGDDGRRGGRATSSLRGRGGPPRRARANTGSIYLGGMEQEQLQIGALLSGTRTRGRSESSPGWPADFDGCSRSDQTRGALARRHRLRPSGIEQTAFEFDGHQEPCGDAFVRTRLTSTSPGFLLVALPMGLSPKGCQWASSSSDAPMTSSRQSRWPVVRACGRAGAQGGQCRGRSRKLRRV